MKDPKELEEYFVLVRFPGLSEQLYSYKVPPYLLAEVGSLVVVEAGDSYGIAVVKQREGILPVQEQRATKYVVTVFDYHASLLRTYREKCVDSEESLEDIL